MRVQSILKYVHLVDDKIDFVNCFIWEELRVSENKHTKITVKINHKAYTIVGSEKREHVELVAKQVDEKMQEIHGANKHLDTGSLAVLTAINTMNDYVKLKAEYDELLELLEEEN